jgi:hypothetical protein
MVRACTFSRTLVACAAMLLAASCSLVHFPHGPPPPFPPAPPRPVAPAPPPQAEPKTPGEVRAEIQHWFSAHGYKDFQVAALLGHARDESGYHPCIAGPGGLRYTFQWASTRLENLHRFANDEGCPPLDKQLAFADSELRQDPKFACFWRATDAESALAALRRGFGRGTC